VSEDVAFAALLERAQASIERMVRVDARVVGVRLTGEEAEWGHLLTLRVDLHPAATGTGENGALEVTLALHRYLRQLATGTEWLADQCARAMWEQIHKQVNWIGEATHKPSAT